MSKLTYEESSLLTSGLYKYDKGFIGLDELIKIFEKVIKRTPTFDEVVKAWEDAIGTELDLVENDEGIRVLLPNGIYYLINLEQVYSNRKVFSLNVGNTFNAINLTIQYLKAQKEQDNEI